MAGPLTHLALTEKVFVELFGGYERRKFVVGTSFPDIRYLGTIERDKTHFNVSNIEQVLAEADSFLAGMKFHSLVDELRHDFVWQERVYDLLPPAKYISQTLKFYEDTVLRSKISNSDEIAGYFDAVTEEELSFGIEASALEVWHGILRDTLTKPLESHLESTLAKIGFTPADIKEIQDLLTLMPIIPQIQKTTLAFYTTFPSLLN